MKVRGKKMNEILENLNDCQKEAVTYKDGPLLILADAGVETTKDIILKLRETIEKNNIKEPTEAKNRLREILISKFI